MMIGQKSTGKVNENLTDGINSSNTDEDCICIRPKSRVVCGVCGYIATGRIQKKCNLHKNVSFISDYDRCPDCGAWPFMMTEYKV